MARSSLLIVFFLIATVGLAIAKPTTEAPAPSKDDFLNELENALLGFDIKGCWTSIEHVEGCATDLFKSLTTFKVTVSRECCNAIGDVSDKCFSVFGSSFAPILKSHCYVFAAPPTPPTFA